MRQLSALVAMLLASGCLHNNFRYDPKEPVYLSAADPKKGDIGDKFETESAGFVWAKCEELNEKAIENLLDDAPEGSQLTGVEWFNYQTRSWGSSPSCVREAGWLATVYLFWWPQATKVKVQGTIVTPKKKGVAAVVNPDLKSAGVDGGCSVSIKGDKFDDHKTFSSYECGHDITERAFFRAFVATNGKASPRYQLYFVTKTDKTPQFFSATALSAGTKLTKETSYVDSDLKCSSGGCTWTTHTVVNLTQREFDALTAKGKHIEVKLRGKSGSKVMEIRPKHNKSFRKAVETHRLAH